METSEVRYFLGTLLMTAGGLIMTLSGLCSALVTAPAIVSWLSTGIWPDTSNVEHTMPQMWEVTLVVGGVPFLAGSLLLLIGILIGRRREGRYG